MAGHIHHAEIRMVDDILYMNDGDFVESKTALAEKHDGSFVLLEMREGQLLEVAYLPLGSSLTTIHPTPVVLEP